MLKIAKDRIQNLQLPPEIEQKIRFQEQDITQTWEVKDHSVDLIFGDLVLEHIQNLAPFFEEAKRTLKSGGILFICEFHPYRQYKVRTYTKCR